MFSSFIIIYLSCVIFLLFSKKPFLTDKALPSTTLAHVRDPSFFLFSSSFLTALAWQRHLEIKFMVPVCLSQTLECYGSNLSEPSIYNDGTFSVDLEIPTWRSHFNRMRIAVKLLTLLARGRWRRRWIHNGTKISSFEYVTDANHCTIELTICSMIRWIHPNIG